MAVDTTIRENYDQRIKELKNQKNRLWIDSVKVEASHRALMLRLMRCRNTLWLFPSFSKIKVRGEDVPISEAAAVKIRELDDEYKSYVAEYNDQVKKLDDELKKFGEETTIKVDSDILPNFQQLVQNIESLITRINVNATDVVLQRDVDRLQNKLEGIFKLVNDDLEELKQYSNNYGKRLINNKKISKICNDYTSKLQTAFDDYNSKAAEFLINNDLQQLQVRVGLTISELQKDEGNNFSRFDEFSVDVPKNIEEIKIQFKSGLFGFKKYGRSSNSKLNRLNPLSAIYTRNLTKNAKVQQEIEKQIDLVEETFSTYVFNYYQFRINEVLVRITNLNNLFRNGRINVKKYNDAFVKLNELYKVLISEMNSNGSISNFNGFIGAINNIVSNKIKNRFGLIFRP